ncbi:acyltransferase [Herbaspirillum sp. AP02]|uniref:acyltransferase family protein n=1 Tax=unclassified Herbaspirillum TaxID=2624150 RepID=UPI0015DB3528|nr:MULTISPECIES: acyltransferase [unclassified Herbaspirillum]MBG7618471.1 acyltransferase [Herbaspirillum sp. AP02]NZD68631.1 acyltransferase [Herbaspirillum sp. AP21]
MSMVHTKHQDIASLDGWRAVAIVIVATSHAGLGKIVPGGLGVTIFFFLSGYLITTLLLREFAVSSSINIKHFYLRRLLRLTPPLLLVLILTYLLTYLGWFKGYATWQGFFAQLFYFANYYGLFFDAAHTVPLGTGVFWSLAVEEHFYFFFPALLLLMLHRAQRKHIPLYLGLACILFLAWRCYLVLGAGVAVERTYYATDTRIDSMLYGCILATLQISERWQQALQKPGVRTSAMVLGAVLLLATLLVRNDAFRETIRYSLQGIALIPLFYYSVNNPGLWPFRWLNAYWVRRVGIYSYSIYLAHYVMLNNVDWVSRHAAVNVLVALFISCLFAVAVDRFVDVPLRVIRARLR